MPYTLRYLVFRRCPHSITNDSHMNFRNRQAATLVLGLILVATVMACSNGPGDAEPTFIEFSPEDDSGGGDDALLVGTVRDATDCLTVEEQETGSTFTPVFPTTERNFAESLRDGDTVELRGGTLDTLDHISGLDVPADCGTDGPYWLVAPAR